MSAFGRLDIFVGNAGVFDRFVPLVEFPEDKLSAACDEMFAATTCFSSSGCDTGQDAGAAVERRP